MTTKKKDIKFNTSGWINISYRDDENILRKSSFDDIDIAWGHVKLLKKMGIEYIYINL